MEDSCRLDVLLSPQNLISEKLVVLIGEFLFRFNEVPEVSFHEFVHYVYISELLSGNRELNGFDGNHIIVVEQAEDFKFSQSPFGEGRMFESFLNLFYGYLFSRDVVVSFTNDSVGASA